MSLAGSFNALVLRPGYSYSDVFEFGLHLVLDGLAASKRIVPGEDSPRSSRP